MRRAAVFCPGRGSYTQATMGRLKTALPFVQRADELRARYELPSLVELDRAERFSPSRHLDPVNASALIWLRTMLDTDRARSEHRVVAVGGNSMGWYTALGVAGALSFDDAFRLMQAMAVLQAEEARRGAGGGQVIYPVVDDDWAPHPGCAALVEEALASSNGEAHPSIRLGGYAVLAGSEAGVEHLLGALPETERGRNRYPFRLAQHGPYHTPLARPVSERAVATLPDLAWRRPEITLIDGRGAAWTPWSTDVDALRDYTLRAQVTEPYDFTASVRTALREYAPDVVVLPGPGNSLGGVTGQVFCREGWRGIRSKADFQRAAEAGDPPLVSMDA